MYQAIVFLPLIGALIAGLAGTKVFQNLGRDADVYGDHTAHADHAHDDHHGHYDGPAWPMYLTTGLLCVSAVLSWIVFLGFLHEGHDAKVEILRWVNSGAFTANWVLRIDTLTAVMLVVVNTISALVHVYSLGYMSHDEHQPRFFAYLSLFTFAMLMLVTSDNLLQMFFGWEGVGLMSYLLIGFWYTRESANAAAIKAFVVNRICDFGFALGIFGCFYVFQSVEFDTIFAAANAQTGKTKRADLPKMICNMPRDNNNKSSENQPEPRELKAPAKREASSESKPVLFQTMRAENCRKVRANKTAKYNCRNDNAHPEKLPTLNKQQKTRVQ